MSWYARLSGRGIVAIELGKAFLTRKGGGESSGRVGGVVVGDGGRVMGFGVVDLDDIGDS